MCILQLCKISNCRHCQEKQFRLCNKNIWIFVQKLFQSIHFCMPFGVEICQAGLYVFDCCYAIFMILLHHPKLYCILNKLNCSFFSLVRFNTLFCSPLFKETSNWSIFSISKAFFEIEFATSYRKWFRFRKPQEKHPFLYRSRRVIKMQEFSTSTWRFTNHFSLVWI